MILLTLAIVASAAVGVVAETRLGQPARRSAELLLRFVL